MSQSAWPIARLAAGTVRDQGPRRVQADAAATWRDTNGVAAWAIADGIGDDYSVAQMAADAARTAARTATRAGAWAGINAARHEAAMFFAGAPAGQVDDAVLVVAVPIPSRIGGGVDIAWVGDSRAYVLREGMAVQVTTDRTRGQEYRDVNQPEWARRIASRYDNVVTTSVHHGDIDTIRVVGPITRIMLCSDGVHGVVDTEAIAAALATDAAPRAAAHRVMAAARAAGLRDNATVTVIGPPPGGRWP
ncbi:protein phosphatase [Parafrankia irregularis]|uniref:Protein phosphatase n=1 Tax=Parafrankia irregularis TaxID=795642 RepID=A0A0S4QYV9_9ACTN|nr:MULTISPECIES: hypothetical protein [Parafrankia]MBE3206680.1 serine/threonine protein phosphatase [Parafrankia sp. CH37]CUU60757.1 protein phosphatase [Parafrankia irregularis]